MAIMVGDGGRQRRGKNLTHEKYIFNHHLAAAAWCEQCQPIKYFQK